MRVPPRCPLRRASRARPQGSPWRRQLLFRHGRHPSHHQDPDDRLRRLLTETTRPIPTSRLSKETTRLELGRRQISQRFLQRLCSCSCHCGTSTVRPRASRGHFFMFFPDLYGREWPGGYLCGRYLSVEGERYLSAEERWGCVCVEVSCCDAVMWRKRRLLAGPQRQHAFEDGFRNGGSGFTRGRKRVSRFSSRYSSRLCMRVMRNMPMFIGSGFASVCVVLVLIVQFATDK
ncbi:hypothetical protein B0T14DRAFT_34855 [Immersiella caudata]|uniref:Transmembrane protein n=1 Tax=Immersiella caudata TaxID=314043 RepID=A0AA40CBN9_9PEZI|nr:hypothetical protein B0T14DRAFT_34855 [Immersiella caudata]